jgi:Glycosyltransferases, probably involved in cell wall biogenesis
MISICIPVYNYDVTSLVKGLHSQCISANINFEIILIDDLSENEFKEINSKLSLISNYIQLDKNVGRSRIRNLFLQYAKYEYLLFLDCDSVINNDQFIKNYLESFDNASEVIVGGRIYPVIHPDKNYLLRWKYCTIREQTDNPSSNKAFMSNNFLIKKELFEKIKFDERIKMYGHEDTLFGYDLKKAGIRIKYINNPVLNGELESNKEFLKKTEQSIENLKYILDFLNYDKGFINEVSLLKSYFFLKKYKLDLFVNLIFKLKKRSLKWFLEKGIVFLWWFDFYKLGYLTSI